MEEGSYTLTLDDLIAANRLHWKQTVVRDWKRALVTGLAGISLLCLSLWLARPCAGIADYVIVATLVIGAVTMLGALSWLIIVPVSRRGWKQSRKMWVPQQVHCDPQGIQFKSERGEVRIRWGDFYQWAADERTLLLYTTARSFFAIPLAGFRSGARETLAGMIQTAGVRQR
jgi:hypothetical protein